MNISGMKDAERILPGKSVGKVVRALERELLKLRKRNMDLENENTELKGLLQNKKD